MDTAHIAQLVTVEASQLTPIKQQWLQLLAASVFDELRSSQLNAVSRLSKRVFEVGAALKSLGADRQWIPRPKEQLKNALASSVKLRDALAAVAPQLSALGDDPVSAQFKTQWQAFHEGVIAFVQPLENAWASCLDSQLFDDSAED